MVTDQATVQADPGAMRVLVVDDDEDTCRSTAMALRLKGHDTRTAFTGQDAMTTAPSFLPELVLLDLSMPDMDGLQLARTLRQSASVPQPVIAAISGYESLFHKTLCAKAGFDHFLTKPVNFTALEHLLWLAGERVPSQEQFASLKRKQADTFYAFCRSQLEFAGLVLDSAPQYKEEASAERSLAQVRRLHDKITKWLEKPPELTEDQVVALRILLAGLRVRLTTLKSAPMPSGSQRTSR
jgi:DNA-binding response OmpR family regulator